MRDSSITSFLPPRDAGDPVSCSVCGCRIGLAAGAIGGVAGAIEGNLAQVGVHLVAVLAAAAFAGGATFAVVKLVEMVAGLRVEQQADEVGLDLALHGEAAYQS